MSIPLPNAAPAVAVEVFPAPLFRVTLGACLGEGLGRAGTGVPGDFYRLAPGALPATLSLATGAGRLRIAAGGDIGRPGAAVAVLGEHRLVACDGETVTVFALEPEGSVPVVLPLAPLARGNGYTLVDSRPAVAGPPLPERVTAAFARGTTVVLADGTPCPVERLSPGAPVLTRDHGAQPLRALLRARLRAAGGQAPVVFAPGTIGNAAELAVSPFHRILLCRPGAEVEAGAAESFVQARHLVDGNRIRQREGGFVEYFSLVFDRHEVVFAEGFPCESLCLTPAATDRLPATMLAELAARAPLPAQHPHPAPDRQRADLAPFLR